MKIPVTCLIFFLSILLFVSCNKKEEVPNVELPPKGYMKAMIEPDTVNPYIGEYYIRADFTETSSGENKELIFKESEHKMYSEYYLRSFGYGMPGQGTSMSNNGEVLRVFFRLNTQTDTLFTLANADYWFADLKKQTSGIDLEYHAEYWYVGRNTADSYCNITYIGDDRINGEFHCVWSEYIEVPIDSKTYDVYGDFSIPMVHAIVYEKPLLAPICYRCANR